MIDPITIVELGVSAFIGSFFIEEDEDEEISEIEEDTEWGWEAHIPILRRSFVGRVYWRVLF